MRVGRPIGKGGVGDSEACSGRHDGGRVLTRCSRLARTRSGSSRVIVPCLPRSSPSMATLLHATSRSPHARLTPTCRGHRPIRRRTPPPAIPSRQQGHLGSVRIPSQPPLLFRHLGSATRALDPHHHCKLISFDFHFEHYEE
ncbi:hypothetical protein E2562_013642 [Oryza meyeriana var. granulata]|uniref:Uncharacterized protein n=1 Tax=Oryza meyeriana var. granulata TaxID=110450 RepID=A0A6G1BJU8_9ORYZ|nr:hypothetical protein E2562_013642 [Oryza meyeriana var. granulata]